MTSQSLVCIITPTVLRASHPLFVWHHTRHRYNIFCTIEDIISSLFEIEPPFLWNHTHYIWPRIDAISVTTSTLLMISHQLYLWDLILYILTSYSLYTITYSLYLYNHTNCTWVSHPPFPWYHTLCIYDISPTIFDTTATPSVWSHPHYWCHHKIMEVIPLGTHMTLYTLYIRSYSHPMTSILSIYDITSTAFMTSDLFCMTSHILFRTSHHFMYDIKSNVNDHIHFICVITPTLSMTSQPLYGCYHIQYNCDIISPIFMT